MSLHILRPSPLYSQYSRGLYTNTLKLLGSLRMTTDTLSSTCHLVTSTVSVPVLQQGHLSPVTPL